MNIAKKAVTWSHLVDELVAQAIASIEAAEYSSAPFPHIVFRNFFPDDFYRELVRSVPARGYDPITGTGTRMALRLYGESLEGIEPRLRPVWAAASAVLTSKRLEEAIRVSLREVLKTRARGDGIRDPDDLRLVTRPVIYKDSDGYRIKPHPDTRKKVVTMQLYCPTDARQRELGTVLYRMSALGLMHLRSFCLEPVKTIPFLPNTGYAFVVLKVYHSLTGMSWHGRPPIKTNQERISILNTFYINEHAAF
jgi:hypothetical protein